MRKLSLFIFCLMLAACAGNRTLDGETTKNWIKIVSSKIDRSGNAQDVCYILDLSFYPGTAYERIKDNPDTCLDQCCWYSENKSVNFYFNDGFYKELEEKGISRRYYPDHIRINLTYAPFLNRLSAKAASYEGITSDGIVMLDYEDIIKADIMNDESLYKVDAKTYPEDPSAAKNKGDGTYKTISMSGLNRAELLARAQQERDKYYADAIAARYEGEERAFVEESLAFTGQVSPFDKTDKEKKWLSKKPLNKDGKNKENRNIIDKGNIIHKSNSGKYIIKSNTKQNTEQEQPVYDVQRTNEQEAKIVYVEPKMPENMDAETLKQKLIYERNEAVKLLKRFYGEEIDGYLRALDKAKKKEDQVLFTSDKMWQTKKIGTPIYKIVCHVNGKIALLGADEGTTTVDYPIDCGTYIVNLDEKTVEAQDQLAQKIAKKNY